jgi:uncharacterized protein
MVERSIIESVRGYMEKLASEGIHPQQAVLFGSYARGTASPESDIDLVVIAPELDGARTLETEKKLWMVAGLFDSRIEPIACGELEWKTDQARPVLEIARQEGIPISP